MKGVLQPNSSLDPLRQIIYNCNFDTLTLTKQGARGPHRSFEKKKFVQIKGPAFIRGRGRGNKEIAKIHSQM